MNDLPAYVRPLDDGTSPELAALHHRIGSALEIALAYGSSDGAHHKMWCIDQMVRELTGCPQVPVTRIDVRGNPYTFDTYGESPAYEAFLAAARGEDNEYSEWDSGIAP